VIEDVEFAVTPFHRVSPGHVAQSRTEAGNREFNSFVWMPPKDKRAGEVLLADSTVFSTLFGADDSLKQFWKNLATAK